MVDFVEYVVSELKSKRLEKANALELMRQYLARPSDHSRLHPLVHCNVSTLTQQRYRTCLTGEESFLRDHRVRISGGAHVPVLPGVAYLEMARAAITEAVPEWASSSLIAFENIVWLSPCAVESKRDIYIDLDADEYGVTFCIFGEDAAGTRVEHASGRARFYDTVQSAPLDVAGIRDEMRRECWDAPHIYEQYAQLGIAYGPAHRSIVRLHRGEARVLAEIELPQALAHEHDAALALHPSLLDGALQAAIGLSERERSLTEPLVPFTLDSLCVLNACPDALYAFIRRTGPGRDDGNQLLVDLDLCDRAGNICVQMRGFCARRLETKAAAANPTTAPGTIVAVPEWRAYRPVEERVASPASFEQRQVVVCDLPAIDEHALASMLAASRVTALRSPVPDDPALRYAFVAQHLFELLQEQLKAHARAKQLVQCVVPDTAEGLLLAGFGAMLKTAARENPALAAQILIVEEQIAPSRLAAHLVHASGLPDTEVIQYHADQWRSREWKIQPQLLRQQAEPAYRENGVYVITGGLGSLGGIFAQDILGQTERAQVVLTGRAVHDAHIAERVAALGFAHRLHYRELDPCDPEQCVATLADIQARIGAIRGVLHCAGTRSDNVIIKKTVQEFAEVLRPKVRGTWYLDRATQQLDLDFFVLFSSGVAAFGNVGQADYAAANGFLDAFAHYREQLVRQGLRHGKTLAINWPLWQDGGMRPDEASLQRLQAQTGMVPMRRASGVAVLRQALASPHPQVLAVEGEAARLRRLFEDASGPSSPRPKALVTPAPAPSAMPAADDLLARTREFLRQTFAPVLNIAAAQIDIDEALESYGINSILAMNLTSQLEKHFGALSKTLFFEYQTIAALGDHFAQAHAATLQTLLSPATAASAALGMSGDKQTRVEAKSPLAAKRRALAPSTVRPRPMQEARRDPIAIVGLSGRYPEARDVQEYWRNLRDGKDCIVEIPRERWRWEDYYTADRAERGHYSKWGGFIAGVDEFDPQFFNISPREAPYIDPQERLFLQHAWMAVEDAAHTRKSLQIPRVNGLAGQVGVYVGVMYGEYNASGSLASIANRVSYVLNLHGPSITLDTMCSSSLTAIHLACQDLVSGVTDLAIAGGVNVSVHPGKYSMLSAGQFISSDGHCQSFGEGGDGYIPGEGVGAVVLKRLSDAEADGDAIYAIIRGSALNHGGKTNGYTVPNPHAQADAIARALAHAGVHPRHVSYVEAHGTGTKLGDPIEIAALRNAFQQHTRDTQYCSIGSAKSNIGHCESAAGIAGLTKVLLQMRYGQIVPSLHSARLNPHIDFAGSPFEVNQHLREWRRPEVDGRQLPRIASLSSFGAGGANAHFVIEEYVDADALAHEASIHPAIVPLSARTPEQLTQKASDLLAFLTTESAAERHIDLASLAYTLQVGREAMDQRLGFVAESVTQLHDALRGYLDGDGAGFCRGHAKAHKETLAPFIADPDFDAILDKWIAQRKLTKLIDLWVKGVDLDWRKLYGGRPPRRMHLPMYPFAQEKYWIDPIKGLFPLDAAAREPARGIIQSLPHDGASDLAYTSAIAATSVVKPNAIALSELKALPAIAHAALAKPNALRLVRLDDTISASVPAQRGPAPVAAAAAPPSTVAPPPRRADLQGYLKRTLAEALYLDEASIDHDRSFVDLGLDSIVGVEWIKRVNKDLGLDIAATRVYDYSTVAALGGYLQSQLPSMDAAAVVNTPITSSETSASASLPPPSALPAIELLQQELRRSLAQALYLDESAIDHDKSFVDLGLDSIVGVEWIRAINKTYGLDISATRVYDYSNLGALAGFLHAELAKLTPERRSPQLAPPPGDAPPALVASKPVPQMRAAASPVSRQLAQPPAERAHRRVEEANEHEEKIAIIGMSGRYPDADDLGQFWRNLVAGRNSIKEIPPERWDVNAYYDPIPGKPGKVYCKWLGVLDGADQFDPLFFQISPSEAEIMDPQHRLFMQEAYHAFEDAGYSSATLSNQKCGVYLGIMSSEYAFLLSKGNALNVETTGNSFAIGAARIAYHLNLKGPAIPIDTACSSSLVGIHLACQALRNREIDMGLAGGVSLYLIPESYLGMCRAGMLSPEGQCKTFDNGANGFVPGEGVGAVVLKRLSDAERDGDDIYGVIIGSGINQDGRTNGITAPSVNSQIELERDIYRKYGIDAASISYVETHGTGTKLGDPIELEALATVFNESTDRRHFCALGAVKTNIGHTSGAAGVAGVHKVLQCLRHKRLVPSLNVVQENALFDFAHAPFYVNKSVCDWSVAPGAKRRAAVSSFGFSGTNAHIVIEEYAPPARRDASGGETYIVPLSARSASQLRTRAKELDAFLAQGDTAISLRELAYTLQVGRDAMRERCAWVVESIPQLQHQLRAFLAGDAEHAATNEGWHRGNAMRGHDGAQSTDELDALRKRVGAQQSAPVATLWAKGSEIDWPSFYNDALPRRVHLPGYPFAKERYWVPTPANASAAQPPASVVPQAIAAGESKQQTCYTPVWREAPLPARDAPFDPDDTLLILDRDDALFQQICARWQTGTPLKAMVFVELADAYRQHGADRFSVDAGNSDHFQALIEALKAQGRMPTRVIHNLNAALLRQDEGDAQSIERALQFSVEGVFALCKALVGGKAQQSPCTFLSFYDAAKAANTSVAEAMAAFYRSLALENNRYRGRVLAFDHARIDAARSTCDTVTCLLAELQSRAPGDAAIRYQASDQEPAQRFVRGLTRYFPGQQRVPELPLKHRGAYLITGGLGGLGYLFSRHLAERYQARLVLSGRSALTEALQQKIDCLRAIGADVLYVQADIAEGEAARQLIERAKARFGQVNGILHSAGVHHDALLINKDADALRKVLAPKVQGTLHLDRLTATEPLDLFVLFSSGAGTFGNAGQTDYAYANAFLDAFADQREQWRAQGRRFGQTLAIAWPFWQEGGMQLSAADLQRTEERTGLCALPTEIGIAYWEALLRSGLTRALPLYGYPGKIAAHCTPPSATIAPSTPLETVVDRSHLRTLTEQYLCELVQRETKIPVAQIDVQERFEAYGFDSVMIGRFNAALESDLGDLPKTLLYEYETVAELADYVCGAVPASLARKFGRQSTEERVASASPNSTSTVAATLDAALSVIEPIAIVGVHAYMPQAKDLDEFWEHLAEGRNLLQLVPESRWDYAAFYDPDPAQAKQGKIYCKWGGFLDDFDRFDAAFFNIAAAEADIIDPQERWFLQSAWAAVEDAGYTREGLRQQYPKGKSADVGVFVGVTTNTYHLLAAEQWQLGNMVTPSAMPWSIANRVSYFFDFQGPSMPVDTACSSSLVAVHLACESLRRGECRIALAGGVNLYLHPAKYHSLCQRRMLAVGERCRSFGAGDDGFIPAEGVGTLVLKPLSAAQRDRDHIYGVVRASACDHSGRSHGYATPNPNAQAQVISRAIAQANIPARSISFIEGHGTGTQMGDSLEVAALTQAFAQQTADKQFCALSSVKANIGHAESATSVAGIAKILLQFKHRQIAPAINAEVVNPDIDFARSPCFLETRLTPWQTADDTPRRALINAFGAGGVNACAVLEEYLPPESVAPQSATGRHLFILSARNEDRLRTYAARYVDFLQSDVPIDIASLCHTVQIGREAMSERLALVIGSTRELREALQHWLGSDGQIAPSGRLWSGSVDLRHASKRATREERERMGALCAAYELERLAQVWVHGGDIDWQGLYPQPLHRVPLPVYPFARERHWVSDAAAAPGLHAVAPAAPCLHPLITLNTSTLKQVSFDAVLSDDQYYARDHRVNGRAIFPGTGFLEMACVAATMAGQHRVRQLKDIVWVQPLPFDRGAQHAQVLLTAVGDSTEFSLVSFDADHEKVPHCEGRVIFDDGARIEPQTPPSLPQWQQRCQRRCAGSEHYVRFRRLAFDYGTAFRTIEEVAIGDACALATLQLDPAQLADFDHYILHPCLIDGALQTVIALLAAADNDAPHLPFAIDEITILGRLTPRCYALVEQADGERSRDAHVLRFNVHILTETGEPAVKITNFYLRALPLPVATVNVEPENDLVLGD